jgi:sugar/nucleoside kinase (ribokinase family)
MGGQTMTDILIMGESLVEIMRDHEDVPLFEKGCFLGPFPSGAPAICASTAARLGCKVSLISGVGKDDFGKCILDRLNSVGVDTSHVLQNPHVSTGCAFVTYFKDGSRKFIFHMGNTPAAEAKAPDPESFKSAKYMHIMGCSLMAKEEFANEILKTMHLQVSSGSVISFDPNIRHELFTDSSIHTIIEDVLENTSIFMPGYNELLSIANESNLEKAVQKCFSYPKMSMLLLKNGSKGSTLFTKDGTTEKIGIYPVNQLDPTGAGDSFDGGFLSGLVHNKSLRDSLRIAAAAGALNAAAFGPMEGDISEETVQKMIQVHPEI